jgi:hypothetical protein
MIRGMITVSETLVFIRSTAFCFDNLPTDFLVELRKEIENAS